MTPLGVIRDSLAAEEQLARLRQLLADDSTSREWLAVCDKALEIGREIAQRSAFVAPSRGEILARAVRIAAAGGRPSLGALLGSAP